MAANGVQRALACHINLYCVAAEAGLKAEVVANYGQLYCVVFADEQSASRRRNK
jgi:hypothetical protein